MERQELAAERPAQVSHCTERSTATTSVCHHGTSSPAPSRHIANIFRRCEAAQIRTCRRLQSRKVTMVTTRSQDRKFDESELPVRPRNEEMLSSPTLTRPRTPVENVPSTKRLRIESDTPVDVSQASQAPALPSDGAHDVVSTSQPDQAVAATNPSHLAAESSHIAEHSSRANAEPLPAIAEEASSDQQPLPHLPHDLLKSAGDPDEAAASMSEDPDSLTSEMDNTNYFTPKTGPPQVHKRFGSEDADTDVFATPETSRREDATTVIPPISGPAPSSSDLESVPQHTNLHAMSRRSPVLVAPRPPLSSIRLLRPDSGPRPVSFASPVKPSNSISRYRQTMLERHRRTPFWGARKARFVDVRAQ